MAEVGTKQSAVDQLKELNEKFDQNYYNDSLKKYGKRVSLVLPQSYDDSLTFYEAINALMRTLNGEIGRASDAEYLNAQQMDAVYKALNENKDFHLTQQAIKEITLDASDPDYFIFTFTRTNEDVVEFGRIAKNPDNPVVELKDSIVENADQNFETHTLKETVVDGTENDVMKINIAQKQATAFRANGAGDGVVVTTTDQEDNQSSQDVILAQIGTNKSNIESTNNRISSIIAQAGDDNTEIVDARKTVTKEGEKILPTIGDAIRQQINWALTSYKTIRTTEDVSLDLNTWTEPNIIYIIPSGIEYQNAPALNANDQLAGYSALININLPNAGNYLHQYFIASTQNLSVFYERENISKSWSEWRRHTTTDYTFNLPAVWKYSDIFTTAKNTESLTDIISKICIYNSPGHNYGIVNNQIDFNTLPTDRNCLYSLNLGENLTFINGPDGFIPSNAHMGYLLNFTSYIGGKHTYVVQRLYNDFRDTDHYFSRQMPEVTGIWTDWEMHAPYTERESTVIIGPNENYKTLRAGLEYAYSISSDQKPVTVIVKPQTYNLISEFDTELSGDTVQDCGIKLGNSLHIIFNPGCIVTALYESTGNEDHDRSVAQHFQPFYTAGNFTIENLNITAQDTRYCIHDEMYGKGTYFTNYINCQMKYIYKSGFSSWESCIGGGLGEHGNISIYGGYYDSQNLKDPNTINNFAITYHNGNSEKALSSINIHDVYISGRVRFTYYGPSNRITKAIVSGCTISNPIQTRHEAGTTDPENIQVIAWNNSILNE